MLSMPIQSLPPPALCSPSNRRGRAPPRSFWANFVGSVDERVAKLRPGRIARERCHVGFGGGDLPVLQAVTEGSISRLVITASREDHYQRPRTKYWIDCG